MPSPTSNPAPDAQTKHKSKKRGSSFFSFLAVKEPTSGALEQYADLQRKQAAAKGTSFMAGVSSQKLPLEVPRVNTKWDGLPQMAAKPDLKRASTVSAATFYGARRGSVATTNSSSKVSSSRRSQMSAESSTADLGRVPPPSLENLSIKSHPRHDSGTGVLYEPLNPPPPPRQHDDDGRTAATGNPSSKPTTSGPPVSTDDDAKQAAVSSTTHHRDAHAMPTTPTIPDPPKPTHHHLALRRAKTTSTTTTQQYRHSCHVLLPSTSTPKEIAPWAEPPADDDDDSAYSSDLPWPNSSHRHHHHHHHHPRICCNGGAAAGIDDVDFITSSPISGDGAPSGKSIEEQIAEAERRTASVAARTALGVCAAAAGRMPPAENAQALARLDSRNGGGVGEEKTGVERAKSLKQKKGGTSRFMRFAGKS
ncbi:hypothetical protein SLS55_009785 [Diplodia seriata]|uniref:Ca2+-modulated nonselective cation channel polycystin n=1 Tax=Diplodia seriata TaxID=420778 RepID=A0ABR3C1U1_9PEZI